MDKVFQLDNIPRIEWKFLSLFVWPISYKYNGVKYYHFIPSNDEWEWEDFGSVNEGGGFTELRKFYEILHNKGYQVKVFKTKTAFVSQIAFDPDCGIDRFALYTNPKIGGLFDIIPLIREVPSISK